MKRLQLACLLLFCGTLHAQLWSGVLAPARAYSWQNYSGIIGYSTLGTLPSASWTQSGSTIGPCGTIGSFVTPTTCGIIAAMTTANGTSKYVLLGSGDFYLSTGMCFQGFNNVEIRLSVGTRIHFGASATSGCPGTGLFGFESSDTSGPGSAAHVVAATAPVQGATTLTIASGANQFIQAGVTEVILDQCATGYTGDPCAGAATDNGNFFDCGDKYAATPTGCSVNGPEAGLARVERFQAEAHLVVSCSPACGTAGAATLTLDSPIAHPNYASGNTPEVYLIQTGQNVGMQGGTVDCSLTSVNACTEFYNMANVWQRNMAVLSAFSISTWINQTIHADVEGVYCYAAGQFTPANDPSCFNHNWGLDVVMNNICQGSQVCAIGNGPTYGDVVGYNYATNPYTGTNFMFSAFQDCHSDGCDYELLEGNVGNQLDEDQIHGTHLMNTFNRNLWTGWTGCNNGQCGTAGQTTDNTSSGDALSYNRYGNWIANVMGTTGIQTTYQSLTGSAAFVNLTVFLVGNGNTAPSPAIPGDAVVGTTIMRWGNWDTVTAAVRECTAASTPIAACTADERAGSAPTYPALASPATTFPASFYYSAAPAWWTNGIPFPAMGPDVTGGNLGLVAGTFINTGHQSGSPAINGSTYVGDTTSTSWAGHANAIPAANCFLNTFSGLPDGTNSAIAFNALSCYLSALSGSSMSGGVALGGGVIVQ